MGLCREKFEFQIDEELKCPEACYIKEKTKLNFHLENHKLGMSVSAFPVTKGDETKDINRDDCPENVLMEMKIEETFGQRNFLCKSKSNAEIRVEVSTIQTWLTAKEQKKYAGYLKLQIYCRVNVRPKKTK